MTTTDNLSITYRPTPDADVERLAMLDSARAPQGPTLVAAIDGIPCAAVPVDGGRAVADPFQRTAEIVALLELRSAQMRNVSGATHRTTVRRVAPLRAA